MKSFHSKNTLKRDLSKSEIKLVLSAFSRNATIEDSHYFDNYNLPCPIKVNVRLSNGESKFVVLRKARHGSVILEAKVYNLLSKHNLPVPRVLAGPKEGMLVLTLLEGKNLQHFSMNSKSDLEKAKILLLTALNTLEDVTDKIARDASPDLLSKVTLLDELNTIANKPPWNSENIFKKAVTFLIPVLERISAPLIFTNGDFQPANFLTDGKKITGFIDFEKACFRDPLMGLAKFPVYDLHPLNKAGFVDMYLKTKGYSDFDFMIRVALFSLITLQKEIPIHTTDVSDEKYQKHVLHLLNKAIKEIQKNK